MDVQQLNKESDTHSSSTVAPHIPFPYMEWLVVGGIAGGIGGGVAGGIAGEMELAAILAILLAPPLAVVGATCGVVAKQHGWRTVRPVCWAIIGGIILKIDSPLGWIIGGSAGGMVNGLSDRSLRKLTKWAVVGSIVGTIGWLLVYLYLIGMGWVFGD